MTFGAGEILRAGGFYPLRNGMIHWSPSAFITHFAVGDIIQGYGGRITGKITAIGETRFLFKVTYGSRVSERVAMMNQSNGWKKVEAMTADTKHKGREE